MSPPGSALRACPRPLSETYDVALVDLDGVVYLGAEPVAGATPALATARERGMRIGFVTNNASRSPATVLAHLRELGVRAEETEVVTSAQTAAGVLERALPAGSAVLVVGTDALAAAIRDRGLVPVTAESAESAVAVVQGHSPDTGWRELAAAVLTVRRGACWVATNADATLPTPQGPMPGNGAFVEVVRRTTGASPLVTGKPEPAMHRECLERMGAARPLVVGDRLDTDIEGANRVGCDSLLVLTGSTDAATLLSARPGQRPTYLALDLGGLNTAHPVPRPAGAQEWRGGGWTVRVSTAYLLLGGSGAAVDALRTLAAAAWARDRCEVRAADSGAEAKLVELGLAS
ncbi:HAD hydrolase-like protein [soil metagenome]